MGGKSVTFSVKGASPEVSVDPDCVPPPANPCTAATVFSSAKTGAKAEAAGIFGTEAGKAVSFVTVERKVILTAPKGASRADVALVDASAPSWDSTTHVLSVSTTASGLVTGSATLTGGKAKTVSEPCSYDGKNYTVALTENTTAKYKSPAGKAITGHTSLTGNLAAPASAKGATYLVETVS